MQLTSDICNSYAGASDREMASIGSTLLTFWMMTSLIVATIYKGNLKAKLISPKIKLPFTNFRELSASDAKPILAKDSILQKYFEVSFFFQTHGISCQQKFTLAC